MFIEAMKCPRCEEYTIHRIIHGAEITPGLLEQAAAVVSPPLEVVAFSVCTQCNRWAMQAWCQFEPSPAVRANYTIRWKRGQ